MALDHNYLELNSLVVYVIEKVLKSAWYLR